MNLFLGGSSFLFPCFLICPHTFLFPHSPTKKKVLRVLAARGGEGGRSLGFGFGFGFGGGDGEEIPNVRQILFPLHREKKTPNLQHEGLLHHTTNHSAFIHTQIPNYDETVQSRKQLTAPTFRPKKGFLKCQQTTPPTPPPATPAAAAATVWPTQ